VRSLSSVDLTPAEGEMFAPPTLLQVGQNDHNALVFGDRVPTGIANQIATVSAAAVAPGAAASSQPQPVTSQPIEIASQLTFSSVSPEWAVENRAVLETTLRESLNLQASEELKITAISRARRALKASDRALQSGSGVRVDFVIGVSSPQRALAQNATVKKLSSGDAAEVTKFAAQLDLQLTLEGKAPLRLEPSAISFTEPEQRDTSLWQAAAAGSTLTRPQVQSGSQWGHNSYTQQAQYGQQFQYGQQAQEPVVIQQADKSSGSSNTLLFAMGGFVLLGGLMFVVYNKGKAAQKAPPQPAQAQDNHWASKVADADYQWNNSGEHDQYAQSHW
jgi:hypothetical protein